MLLLKLLKHAGRAAASRVHEISGDGRGFFRGFGGFWLFLGGLPKWDL